jgi:hypothetical protein
MSDARSRRRRSLWPREHGAYVQLAVPILTALAMGAPTAAALLLATAASAIFLANEPLLVVLGHRGRRMKEHDGERARRRLLALSTLAAAAGGIALARAPLPTLAMAVIAAVPCAVMLVLAIRGTAHTHHGELVAAVAIPGMSVPVAVASEVSPKIALLLWGAWALGFTSIVLAVHRVIARHTQTASFVDVCSVACLAGVGATLVLAGGATAAPFAVLVMFAAALVIHPPRATRLRTVGIVTTIISVVAGSYAVFVID